MSKPDQPNVHIKSYFAASVPHAIEMARAELGPEALLLDSRRAPPEARHLGAVEVVFGIKTAPAPASHTTAEARKPAGEADELTRKLDEIRSLLLRSGGGAASDNKPGDSVRQPLIDAGFTAPVASEIAGAVTGRLSRNRVLDISSGRNLEESSLGSLEAVVLDEIGSRVAIKPGLGRVTALIGPPGSGKTSTIVKLAVTQGLMKSRPVRLISADTQRIGAAEQLRTYASILGVPFERADNPAVLSHLLSGVPEGHLILIDTPGLSPALLRTIGPDLVSSISHCQEADTQLVIPASMAASDMAATARRYDAFRPSALIFTKLDETISTVNLLNLVLATSKPVSWLCNGQLIPEDIEAALREKLTAHLADELPRKLRSAA